MRYKLLYILLTITYIDTIRYHDHSLLIRERIPAINDPYIYLET
jgi:hypothetical protein